MRAIRKLLHDWNLASYPEFCNMAPVVQRQRQHRKTDNEQGQVGRHGKRTTVTGDRLETDKVEIEWEDTTKTIGKDTTRSAQYTSTDEQVLSFEKYAKLDKDKYKILKQVWSENVSAAKAGTDYRVQNMEGAGLTIRKLYWSAFNAAHEMEKQNRGEAAR